MRIVKMSGQLRIGGAIPPFSQREGPRPETPETGRAEPCMSFKNISFWPLNSRELPVCTDKT